MKVFKRLLKSAVSLAIAINIIVYPITTVNAASYGIASLTVQDFYRTWASASTTSSGVVMVSLSINTIRTSDGYQSGNGTGSSGYTSVGVGLNSSSGFVITSASSSHTDIDLRVSGSWNVYNGYSFYYY